MKFLVTHDAKGNIASVAGQPANAPAGAVAVTGGELVTLVDLPDIQVDPASPDSANRLAEIFERYRVEVKTEAKLVRRNPREG